MTHYPEALRRVITALARLPGIGKRSAERIALSLLEGDPTIADELAASVGAVRAKVRHCSRCGNLTESDLCDICQDPTRDASLLCVVEEPRDILSLEKAGSFRGRYHALMGRLSPLEDIHPEDLRIRELEQRLAEEPVKEVILALGSDTESETTAVYLGKLLKDKGVHVTRIAYGISAGMGLEYADSITLSRALDGRRAF